MNDVTTSQAQALSQPLTRRAIREAERLAALQTEAPAAPLVFASRRERRAAERVAVPAAFAAPVAAVPAETVDTRPVAIARTVPAAKAAPLANASARRRAVVAASPIAPAAPIVPAAATAPALAAVVIPTTVALPVVPTPVNDLRDTEDLSDAVIDEIEVPLSFRRNVADLQPAAAGTRRGSKRAYVRVRRRGAVSTRSAAARGAAGATVLGFAATVAVATTLPAAAQHTDTTSVDTVASMPGVQSFTVGAGSVETVSATAADRGEASYAVATMGTATAYNTMFGVPRPDPNAYSNNPTAAVQWPFPVGVVISDYYGGRIAPCSGCSSDHKGVDFTPGEGTPIGSVAAGRVITAHQTDNGGLGVYVEVEHYINGQRVVSVYAHLLTGSIPVQVGDIVNVGDEVGKVGNTGSSTGAHLHLEIHIGTEKVDPFAWLAANNVAETVVDRPEAPVPA